MRSVHSSIPCVSRKLCLGATAIALILGSTPPRAYGQAWKDSLETALEADYPLSKRGSMSADRVSQQGVVMVIRKDGITADLSSDITLSVTKVQTGEVGEDGGATAAIFSKSKSRSFKTGERVYLIDLKVGKKDVTLLLLSVEMFDVSDKGSTKQTRYKASVKFEFPEGYLATATVPDVEKAIEAVVAPEATVAAAATKTIALGQTRAQVEEILGKPQRIVDLGTKVMYVYPDMKVTFLDGKVADVQ